MPPEAYKEMQVETTGEFGGLGIQVGMKDKFLTVIAPIEDTPAYRAGIKAGDKIVRINKEPTQDMTLEDAVSKMRGAPKTSVTIGIMREGGQEP
jgi:carboxyl-terminal processing protease